MKQSFCFAAIAGALAIPQLAFVAIQTVSLL